MKHCGVIVVNMVRYGLRGKPAVLFLSKLKLHCAHSEKLIIHLAEAYKNHVYLLVAFQGKIFVVKRARHVFGYGIIGNEPPCHKLVLTEPAYVQITARRSPR